MARCFASRSRLKNSFKIQKLRKNNSRFRGKRSTFTRKIKCFTCDSGAHWSCWEDPLFFPCSAEFGPSAQSWFCAFRVLCPRTSARFGSSGKKAFFIYFCLKISGFVLEEPFCHSCSKICTLSEFLPVQNPWDTPCWARFPSARAASSGVFQCEYPIGQQVGRRSRLLWWSSAMFLFFLFKQIFFLDFLFFIEFGDKEHRNKKNRWQVMRPLVFFIFFYLINSSGKQVLFAFYPYRIIV